MIRIGIICPSEIAYRRFMPALLQVKDFKYIGVGVSRKEERLGEENYVKERAIAEDYNKAQKFLEVYGGIIFNSYNEMVTSELIDAVYLPLPPALHYRWAKEALQAGKHVLVEKPATIMLKDTIDLVHIASDRGLALHENYMFIFHKQLDVIEKIIQSGELGRVRLYRISFGFPKRKENDFRYNQLLGGGAFIDAGGYMLKYATRLLGKDVKIRYAQMNKEENCKVDLYGSAAISNKDGTIVQISYGMDNSYKCELEIWGSHACLKTGRILTAPAGFVPTMVIYADGKEEIRQLPADDAFKKSIEYFRECIRNREKRVDNYSNILYQSKLMDQYYKIAKESRY